MASHPRLLIAQSHCNQHALSSTAELLSCHIPILYTDYRSPPKFHEAGNTVLGAGAVNGLLVNHSRSVLFSELRMGYRHLGHLA